MAPDAFDVLVVGGGTAGGCAALGLARAGFEVAVLEHAAATAPGSVYEERVSSINLASERVLAALDAWRFVEAGRLSAFDTIEVRDHDDDRPLRFEAADAGLDHFGHILENNLVAWALRRALEQHDACTLLSPDRLVSLRRERDAAIAGTEGGREIRARLVVGADGASSKVRELAGIRTSVFPYRQHALVCRVRTARHHGATARQRFLPTGPLALLPLADGTCSIVWSTAPATAARLAALDDDDFAAELGAAFGDPLGPLHPIGPRLGFPLQRSHAHRYVDDHVALIGDACHTVHPLAGLGANQGIADADCLVDSIVRAAGNGDRYWSHPRLERYQRRRRPVNGAILSTMDLFHFGFASDSRVLGGIRRGVLGAVAHSRSARNFFVARATGLFAS